MKIIERNTDVYIGKHRDRWIIDTKHSIDRFSDRERFDSRAERDEFRDDIIWVISNAIDEILDKYKDESKTYVVHSDSTNIGLVLGWRREGDKRYDDGNNHAIIITLLPFKTKHHASGPNDTMLIVELRDQIENYLRSSKLSESSNRQLREAMNDDENTIRSIYMESLDMSLIFFGGELYDIDGIVIEVE